MTVITIFFMFFDVLGFGVVISFLHPGGLITIHTSNFKDKLIKWKDLAKTYLDFYSMIQAKVEI